TQRSVAVAGRRCDSTFSGAEAASSSLLLVLGNIRVPKLNNLVSENQFSYSASDNLKEKSMFWTESTIQFDDLEGSALCDSPSYEFIRMPRLLLC
ncbi:hypothetical protein ACJX0J_034723, partial [Zea mays]